MLVIDVVSGSFASFWAPWLDVGFAPNNGGQSDPVEPTLCAISCPEQLQQKLLFDQLVAVGGYRIGGAYKMPPAVHNAFRPRGIPSFESVPTLRS